MADVDETPVEDILETAETPDPEEAPQEDTGFSFMNEKEEKPCGTFRLDTTAGFGMCKCGWRKAEHVEKKKNKAAELLTNLRKKNRDGLEDVEGKYEGEGPCPKFKLDTTASEFGVCKFCGFKRADHDLKGENKAKQALDRLKSSNLDKYKDMVKDLDQDGPCPNYRVDTSASEFGVCHCGFKKEDHVVKEENAAAKMLRNLKEKNKAKNDMLDAEAAGIVEEPVKEENQLPDIEQLNKAEQEAAQVKKKKKPKKKGGPCVIS